MKAEDLTGVRFGTRVVISRAGSNSNGTTWNTKCERCHTEKVTPRSIIVHKIPCRCTGNNKAGRPRKLSDEQIVLSSLFSTYRGSAIDKHLVWELSRETFWELVKENCHYCEQPPNLRTWNCGGWQRRGLTAIDVFANGIDRKDNTKGYSLDNVVSCCKLCQYAKRDLPYEVFISYLKRIAALPKFQPSKEYVSSPTTCDLAL
jgi:hypothetical protein